MKTKQFLRVAVCCLLTMTVVWSAKAFMNHGEDGITIPVRNVSTDPQGAPRDIVPFFAEYYESLTAVMLGCNTSVGDVTVTLTSTVGDWYQTEFDTSEGAILIPASGDSGHYTLTIETAAHVVYAGEFYL